MELMSRLASAVNVCLSEESVIIGDNGLLTAESLNALQHSGAISVYNTLQMNDWKYPLPEEGEMVVSRPNWSAAEDPADLDKILKTETPALHLTECLVDGDQTELLGGVRPLRGLLPPTLIFRSVAEVEDETAFDTQDVSQPVGERESAAYSRPLFFLFLYCKFDDFLFYLRKKPTYSSISPKVT